MSELLRRLRTELPGLIHCDARHLEAADEIERLTAENSRLETALRWALGESPPDTPDFPIVDSPPYYRWRTQLRVLSGLSPVSGRQEQGCPICSDPLEWKDNWYGQCPRCRRKLPVDGRQEQNDG